MTTRYVKFCNWMRVQPTCKSCLQRMLYSGLWSMCHNIVTTEGISGLYRGLSLLLIREVPGYFFFFGGYEGSRWLFTSEGKTVDNLGTDVLSKITSMYAIENVCVSGSFPLFVAGGIAGISYWLSIYPVDVIKSKAQVRTTSFGLVGIIAFN